MGDVAGEGGADVDAGLAAFEPGGVDPGAFQQLPGDLEREPLLRVHRPRLARADAEELRVEQIGVVQEPTFAGVAGAGMVGVVVEQAGEVPAPAGGKPADGIATGGHELPQVFR
ncbi:hypothetical protein Phou_049610 [Phytohabitans houttuyneae]|uniref:Uncharacterized protein n=1 Tax=Phytohabitans houttuyneae TaxID=1076126 RepID=A0A6V8KEC1_9ACTN|nr:hypothetical protein Phou_049610 [Phytohabitans houttuyneae]